MEVPPEKIVVLFAVPQELAPFARRYRFVPGDLGPFRCVYRNFAERSVTAAAAGIGGRAAAGTATRLLRALRPDLLVMAGVAGALCPKLSVGDVVVAETVIADGELLAPPAALPEHGSPRRGGLLSVDRVLVTAREKKAAAACGAVAVEMETAAVARAAEAAGVAWAAVRSISDTAAEALPLDFNALRAEDGTIPTSRVALAALGRPAAIPGLVRLGRNTELAAERLADYLGHWLATLT